MKKEIFRGAATALITPFRDGAVDFEAFGAILDHQLAAGISALVVCGTTGEASTMTEREQIDTVAFAVRHVSGRVPVIAGAGSNNTAHAIELSRECCRVGADALLVVTPYYNKTSQKGLVRMYTEIADSVEKPLILYNVPRMPRLRSIRILRASRRRAAIFPKLPRRYRLSEISSRFTAETTTRRSRCSPSAPPGSFPFFPMFCPLKPSACAGFSSRER